MKFTKAQAKFVEEARVNGGWILAQGSSQISMARRLESLGAGRISSTRKGANGERVLAPKGDFFILNEEPVEVAVDEAPQTEYDNGNEISDSTSEKGTPTMSNETQTAPVETKAAPKRVAKKKASKKVAKKTPAAKKTAKAAAKKKPTKKASSKAPVKKVEGLRKPQVRILEFLSKCKGGQDRKTIAAKAPVDYATLTEYVGSANPEKRAENDTKHFPSLITLKYVKVEKEDVDGKDVLLFSITALGRKKVK